MPKIKEQIFWYEIIDEEIRATPWMPPKLQQVMEDKPMESFNTRKIQKDIRDMKTIRGRAILQL